MNTPPSLYITLSAVSALPLLPSSFPTPYSSCQRLFLCSFRFRSKLLQRLRCLSSAFGRSYSDRPRKSLCALAQGNHSRFLEEFSTPGFSNSIICYRFLKSDFLLRKTVLRARNIFMPVRTDSFILQTRNDIFFFAGVEYQFILCEGNSGQISCSNKGKINVAFANYGRLDLQTCPHKSMESTNCRAANSLARVMETCHDKVHCQLTASHDVYGDPCFFTYKYLLVRYQCG